jgi:HSP20 family protein
MTVTTGWDLFEDLRAAQDEIMRVNRLRGYGFAQVGPHYDESMAKAAWAPAVDISERKDAYLVMVELPGVGMDDLEITFEDGLLTIQGERSDVHDSSTERLHRVERRYGTFRRSITLPSHVMADGIEATAADGVLQILVPKAVELHAKRIQVHVGQAHDDPAPSVEARTSG